MGVGEGWLGGPCGSRVGSWHTLGLAFLAINSPWWIPSRPWGCVSPGGLPLL